MTQLPGTYIVTGQLLTEQLHLTATVFIHICNLLRNKMCDQYIEVYNNEVCTLWSTI